MNPYNTHAHFVRKHAAAAARKTAQQQQRNPRSEYAANIALAQSRAKRNTQEK